VIALRRPADYAPDQGATFELHFEKSRGLCGEQAASLEAQLTTIDGRRCWTWRTLEDGTYERVIVLLNDGISQADIAQELEVNPSAVSRYARKARNGGRLPRGKGAS
jgi:hypothetical protein